MSARSKPTRLQAFVDYRVRVALHESREIVGTLKAFDRHMNLVLVDAEEFRTLKRSTEMEPREMKRSLGMVVLRGETIIHVFPEAPPVKDAQKKTGASTASLAMGTVSIVRPPTN